MLFLFFHLILFDMKNDKFIAYYQYEDQFDYLHSVATPPEEVPIELHDFYEFYYFLSGDMVFYIEGKAYPMKRGDILIINNDELHRASPQTDEPYERIVIHFNRAFLEGFSSGDYHIIDFLTRRKLGHANLIGAEHIDTRVLFRYLEMIEKAVKEDTIYSFTLVKTYFIQLLVEMSRLYSSQTENIITPKQYDERITAIIKYITSNLDQKLTLKELEDRFYINKYYLCHVFKKNTGFTVFEYISNKRIMRAKQLLTQGIPVIETCFAVGFSDYSNFYKVFKRVTGIPPKQFAKLN